MDLLDADFAGAHVAAAEAELPHAGERVFAQVAALDTGRDERHRDVALHAVHAAPGRDQRQDARHQVHEDVRRVAPVAARLPQLVQAGAADHQRRVELQAVRAERWIFPEFLSLYNNFFSVESF